MTDQPVLLEVAGGVATITVNRPEAMNAIDAATKVALLEALQRTAADPEIRCVVLTGTGRAFCVGQDLKEHIETLMTTGPGLETVTEHFNPMVNLVSTMPKPVIAAVNGVAAGAGASLAFACDFRILADTGGFNTAFTGIALSCDTGISWTLPRLVGRSAALDLLYFPRTIGADESLALGLATSVVPAGEVASAATDLATRLANGPTVAYGAVRRAVAHSVGHDLESSLAFEAEMMRLTGATQDHRDAVEAFLAKEKPVFHGR